jgi:alpha-beta hydrolase superfamily lysophospholipase
MNRAASTPRSPRWWWLPLLAVLASCSQFHPAGPPLSEPLLATDHIIATDGFRLPLWHWYPDDGAEPAAVVLAAHGFNDYGASLDVLARELAATGVAVYAYDQRGFGATGPKGIWAGQETLAADLAAAARLLRARYPDKPLYLLGKSMGGALTIAALTAAEPPPVDGAVLIAPALWGRQVMPWYQRAALTVSRYLLPGVSLSGRWVSRFGVLPSDDPEVLRAQSLDPLVQKSARIDTLYGLSELMDTALRRAPRLSLPVLLLYGGEDQVIPPSAMCELLDLVPGESPPWRMAFYPRGYHMLTRYTGAALTHADVAAWLADPAAALPSGAEVDGAQARRLLCEEGGADA